MDWSEFQDLVQILFSRPSYESLSIETEDEKITVIIGETTIIYSHQEFTELLLGISSYTNGTTFIYKNNEIEILLNPLDPRYNSRLVDDGIVLSAESISYSIQTPSDEMILAFLASIPKEKIRDYRRPVPTHFLLQRLSVDDAANISLFDILIRFTRASLSLKVVSNDSVSAEYLKLHANSFLFSLAYNTGTTFKLISDISDLSFGRGRTARRRRLNPSEIEPPKLFYNNELIEHYNLALSSDDSFIQFISYYHIMEYFFDDVYSDALISSVKDVLQHPGFSSKKNKEIIKLIDVIQKKTKVTKEEFLGSELEALELTLKRYVSMDELKLSLSEYDSSLINYYRTHEVSFSKGDAIDLGDTANEKLPKKIAARIYKTRNSLVHNKSNNTRVKDRGIYHPFSDEKELMNEIPLMRIIAEWVIIKSARPI